MDFNTHSDLEGKHAFLSPSQYHWINYSDDRLEARFIAAMAAKRGTDLHELAHMAVNLGIHISDDHKTLALYVNDAIDFKMSVEVCLYYSPNCFGHADTISFRDDKLRVHDLKTGVTFASEHQLEIYASLFCLEYGISPLDIQTELRIYQNDEVRFFNPFPETLVRIMDRIVLFDKRLEQIKESGGW